MEHFGSGSAKLNPRWDKYFIDATGKSAPSTTRIPKTDMYIGNQHISLKKAGGSQLMSGGKAESLATLAHVYDKIPSSVKTKEFNQAWRTLGTRHQPEVHEDQCRCQQEYNRHQT